MTGTKCSDHKWRIAEEASTPWPDYHGGEVDLECDCGMRKEHVPAIFGRDNQLMAIFTMRNGKSTRDKLLSTSINRRKKAK